MFQRRVFLTCCLFLCAITSKVTAQNSPTYSDAGSWNTFSINYSINKKVTLLFTEELRLRENYSRLNLFYTNIGVEYKHNKYFKTALVYRWINKYTDENRFSFRHRLMWDAIVKVPIRKFSFSYRHRLQVEKRNIQTSINGRLSEWYSRSKFEVNYALTKKVSPNFSTEFRYQLKDFRNIESENQWHRIRFQSGIDYTHSKKSKFGIYYLVQLEYNVSAPENIYITGLEYTLNLGRK